MVRSSRCRCITDSPGLSPKFSSFKRGSLLTCTSPSQITLPGPGLFYARSFRNIVVNPCELQRYCRGTFTKSYKKTIGVDFLEKQLRVHGEEVLCPHRPHPDIPAHFLPIPRILLPPLPAPVICFHLLSPFFCYHLHAPPLLPTAPPPGPSDAVGHGRSGGVRRPHQVLLQRSPGPVDSSPS